MQAILTPSNGQSAAPVPDPEPQRLFQCSTCKRSFTRADHLTRHVRAREYPSFNEMKYGYGNDTSDPLSYTYQMTIRYRCSLLIPPDTCAICVPYCQHLCAAASIYQLMCPSRYATEALRMPRMLERFRPNVGATRSSHSTYTSDQPLTVTRDLLKRHVTNHSSQSTNKRPRKEITRDTRVIQGTRFAFCWHRQSLTPLQHVKHVLKVI
jgi:hypothetical protein